jgi:hypothetical protein
LVDIINSYDDDAFSVIFLAYRAIALLLSQLGQELDSAVTNLTLYAHVGFLIFLGVVVIRHTFSSDSLFSIQAARGPELRFSWLLEIVSEPRTQSQGVRDALGRRGGQWHARHRIQIFRQRKVDTGSTPSKDFVHKTNGCVLMYYRLESSSVILYAHFYYFGRRRRLLSYTTYTEAVGLCLSAGIKSLSVEVIIYFLHNHQC